MAPSADAPPLNGQRVSEASFRDIRCRHSSRPFAQEDHSTHVGRKTRLSKRT